MALKWGVRHLPQVHRGLDVAQHLRAGRHERSAGRTGYRNRYRERPWDTRAETVDLRVPRVRDGAFFPAWLEPPEGAEQVPVALLREASVSGVSTRWVDDMVKACNCWG